MTPEEALDLARFQRPGIKIVVGPTEAREERLPPAPMPRTLGPLHHQSWLLYDMHRAGVVHQSMRP